MALEYDGRWHDEPEQRRRDKARRKEMRKNGWIISVIRAEDLYDDPDGVVARVVDALGRRGCPVATSLAYQRWFQPRGLIAWADGIRRMGRVACDG